MGSEPTGRWKKPVETLPRRQWWLFARRLMFTAAAIGLMALLVQTFLDLKPSVPLMVAVVPSYDRLLGPLVSSEADRRLLTNLGSGRAGLGRGTVRPIDLSARLGDVDKEHLRDVILSGVGERELRGGGPGRRTAIVYVTCAGAVDRDGRACLVPPRLAVAGLVDVDRAWLRVTDLLESLAKLERRPANLVVVLDACRPAHAEPLGILDGGFAAAVEVDVRTANKPGIHVVVPAGPGQTSCAAASESASVFTATFIDGIEGCADANGDGRVTLGELGNYLTDEVERRAVLHHGRRQNPFIVPAITEAGRDIGVSWHLRDKPLDWIPDARPPSEDSWLADRWQKASKLRLSGIANRPEAWAAVEHLLLRAERSAGAEVRTENDLRVDVETIEERLAEPVLRGDDLPGLRLASLAGFETADLNPAWQRALESWPGAGPDTAATPPPAPRDAAEWRARIATAWREAVKKIKVGTEVDLAAWEWWTDLLGSPPNEGGAAPPWPFEIQATRLLVHHGDKDAWRREMSTFGRVIALLEESVVATLPSDVRADPLVAMTWTRREADRWRRQAYDLAFVGDVDSMAKAGRLERQAAAAYAEITQAAEAISGHWRLLDQIRAELPWLALWLKEQAVVAADRSSNGAGDIDWPELLEATHDLEEALTADVAGDRGGMASDWPAAAARARRQFIPLRKAFDDACERLIQRSAENATTLAEIRAALAVPLVMGPQRLRLLERERSFADATGRLRDGRVAGGRQADASDITGPQTAGWVGWRDGLIIDPFVAAIVPDVQGIPAPRSATDLADAHAKWGQLLRESAPGASGEAVTSTLASRAVASRRLAVMGNGRFASDSPATEQLQDRWHQRLASAAEDAVDEFLSRHDRDEPEWFLAAAETCLAEARLLVPAGRTDPRLISVAERVQALERAGDRWAELVNSPDAIGRGDGRGSALVTSTLSAGPAVPPGEAALWLSPRSRDDSLWLQLLTENGSAHDLVRAVPLPVALADVTDQPRSARWRVDARSVGQLRADGRSTLDVTAWFRGHRIEAPLRLVTDGGGMPLVWKQRETNPPRITVAGHDKRTGHVTFIFDCSSSMKSEQMAKAKGALQAILESLAQAGSWEASIWFYGHRARLTSAKKPKQVGYSTLGSRQDSVDPDMDVEQIQPMSPVTRASVQSLEPVLRSLVGWGQTPLYLSMCEALDRDSKRVPGDAVWRVIVLTDGINFANAPNDKTDASVRASLRTVNEARATNPVALDVVALDLTPKPDEQAEYEKLRALVKEANGQWRDASDVENLKQAFREFLGLERWEVMDASGRPQGQAELGGSLATKLSPGTYSVRLEGRPATETTLELAGGEIVELFSAGPDRPLEHRRYDGGTEQGIRDSQSGLEDPGDPNRRWFVAAHLPQREGGGRVRFPVSLQADDERVFSPRPAELWAEVRPQGATDTRPFVFVDPDFEPARPVPVIDLEIAWPAEAEEADLLVWFSPRRIDPAAVIRLADLKFDKKENFLFSEEFPGVTFTVELKQIDDTRSRVAIVEKHEGASELPRLRLRVEPECERAERLVDEASGTVSHVFDIGLERGELAKEPLVSIVDRDALKQHCVKPAEEGGRRKPLRVKLPRPD